MCNLELRILTKYKLLLLIRKNWALPLSTAMVTNQDHAAAGEEETESRRPVMNTSAAAAGRCTWPAGYTVLFIQHF